MKKIFTLVLVISFTLSINAQLIWEGSFEQTAPSGQQDAFLAPDASVASRVGWENKMATDSYWNNVWSNQVTATDPAVYSNKATIVSDAHSGSQAILFEISHLDASNRLRSTIKTYTNGDWVKATFWAKTDAAGVAKGGKLIGLFKDYSHQLTTAYQEFVAYGQVGSSGRIEFWFPDAGNTSDDDYKVWLDDVTLEWAPDGPPYTPEFTNFPHTEDFESANYTLHNSIAKQNATDGELDSWVNTNPQVIDRFWRGNNTTEYLATVDGDAYEGSKAMKLAISTKLNASLNPITAYDFRLRTVNLPEGDYTITLYAKTDAAGAGKAKIGFSSEISTWETLTTEYKAYSGSATVTINTANNSGRLIIFYTSDPTLTSTQSYNMWIDKITIEEGTSTAIDEDIKQATLKLFPNPATSQLNLQADGVINNVEIYNISGQKIMDAELSNNNISVSELPNGVYILSAVVDGQPVLKKFMKQ